MDEISTQPTCRPSGTLISIMVFYLLEAPYLTKYDFRATPWPDFFNLTWTYRRDSDILARHYLRFYLPTGLGEDRKSRHARLAGKRNRALAMISNCRAPSNRDEYVRELQRHFPVDVAGDCGTITWPKKQRGLREDVEGL